MAAAEHGADFPMARKLRQTMSHDQLHDFAVGSMANKPEHILKGESHDVIHSNVQTLKNRGMNEHDATVHAIKASKSRHLNLGKYLHPRKDGKPHGSPKEDFNADPDGDGIPDAFDPQDQ